MIWILIAIQCIGIAGLVALYIEWRMEAVNDLVQKQLRDLKGHIDAMETRVDKLNEQVNEPWTIDSVQWSSAALDAQCDVIKCDVISPQEGAA